VAWLGPAETLSLSLSLSLSPALPVSGDRDGVLANTLVRNEEDNGRHEQGRDGSKSPKQVEGGKKYGELTATRGSLGGNLVPGEINPFFGRVPH